MLAAEELMRMRSRWLAWRAAPVGSDVPDELAARFAVEAEAAAKALSAAEGEAARASELERQIRATLAYDRICRLRSRVGIEAARDETPVAADGRIVHDLSDSHAPELLARLAVALHEPDREAARAALGRALARATPRRRRQALVHMVPLLPADALAAAVHEALADAAVFEHEASELAALLPPTAAVDVLTTRLASAAALPTIDGCWSAFITLTKDLPEETAHGLLRRLYSERQAREADPDEIFAVPTAALDAELLGQLITREATGACRPFTAWRLGWWARELPADERGPVLDLAIAEFDRLVPTPIGPGNDAGPFCDLADLLDAAQTRRALAVVDRMAATGSWGVDVDAARGSLVARLAALGQDPEAEARLVAIADAELRGTALGHLLGHALAREPGLGWAACVRALAADPAGGEPDFQCSFVFGFTEGWPERPPSDEVLAGCRALALAITDPWAQGAVVRRLLAQGLAFGPRARWHELVRTTGTPADRLPWLRTLALAAAMPAEAQALTRELVELLAQVPDEDRADWFEELCVLHDALADRDLIALWTAWLARAGDGLPAAALAHWCDAPVADVLPAVLRRLAGDSGLTAAIRVLDELPELLP